MNSLVSQSASKTIVVSNTAELNAALRVVKGGETILLQGGTYDRLQVTNRAFASEVTIKSADSDNPAMFKGIALNRVQNLTFDDVNVTYATHQAGSLYARAMSVQNSNNIEVRNSNVHGSVDGNFGNDGVGIGVLKSTNVSLVGNTFHDLHRGAVLDDVVNAKVNKNYVYDIRSDGFDFTEVKNIIIDSNNFGQFKSASTNAVDHPGIIQFWSNGAEKPSENIVISNNVSLQSSFDGFPVGGIFLRDEKGNLPYRNVLIENNVIYTRDADSITLGHVIGGVVRNNTVLSVPGSDYTASINVWDRSAGISVVNNLANGLQLRTDGITSANNQLVQWHDPNRPGFYGDVLVNGLKAKSLADLIGLPGVLDPNVGSLLISQLADKPEAFIMSSSKTGSIDSLTNTFSVSSFEPGQSLTSMFGKNAVFEWTFGDGTKATGVNVAHTYQTGGIFDVQLTVRSPAGVETFNKSVFIYNPVVLDMKFDGNLRDGSDVGRIGEWVGAADYVVGRSGQAADFDGGKSTTNVIVHDVDNLSGMRQMTMTFDFKAEGSGSGRMVWLHGSFGVEINNGRLQIMTVTNDGVTQWTRAGDVSLVDGRWHNFSMRYDGIKGELDILVDGNLAGRAAGHFGALAETTNGRDLTIGGAFGRNFDGQIDNLKIIHGVDVAPARPLVSDAGGVTVRGSNIADLLLNAEGNDVFRGGAGADQFKFDSVTVKNGDVDRLADVDFRGGDRIVFAGFDAGEFKQIAGGNVLQVTDNGRGVVIDSFADIRELVQASGGSIQASRINGIDLQIQLRHDDGLVQHLVITNGWVQY